MNVLMHRAGALGLSAGEKLSRVCRHKIVDYLTCFRDVQIPSTAPRHSPILQELSRGRVTGIGFLDGAVVRKGREHGVAAPVNTCIVRLAYFRESPESPGER